MALTIKELFEKNKQAYKQQFYLDSVFLSYNLILKTAKQICSDEGINMGSSKLKLSDVNKHLKSHYAKSPMFTKKLKKSVFKDVCLFNDEFKALNKELKYQYPELKLKNAAKRGLDILVKLNTSLIKLKNNSH